MRSLLAAAPSDARAAAPACAGGDGHEAKRIPATGSGREGVGRAPGMMRISRIALGLVGAVAQRLNALACAGMTGESSQDSLPDFTGKVVVVYHAGSRDPY